MRLQRKDTVREITFSYVSSSIVCKRPVSQYKDVLFQLNFLLTGQDELCKERLLPFSTFRDQSYPDSPVPRWQVSNINSFVIQYVEPCSIAATQESSLRIVPYLYLQH